MKLISPDDNIRWNKVGNLGIRAAEHEIFARALEIRILDLEWSSAIPSGNRLRVTPLFFEVGQIRIDYRRLRGVQSDSAPAADAAVAVNVAALEYDVMRKVFDGACFSAQRHEAVNEHSRLRPDFDADQSIVVSSNSSLDRRVSVSLDHRHQRRIGRRHPSSRPREIPICCIRSNRDPAIAAFFREIQ